MTQLIILITLNSILIVMGQEKLHFLIKHKAIKEKKYLNWHLNQSLIKIILNVKKMIVKILDSLNV